MSESKRTIEKINKAMCWLFERVDKVKEYLAKVNEQKEKTERNNVTNDEGEITTDTREIQSIIGGFF